MSSSPRPSMRFRSRRILPRTIFFSRSLKAPEISGAFSSRSSSAKEDRTASATSSIFLCRSCFAMIEYAPASASEAIPAMRAVSSAESSFFSNARFSLPISRAIRSWSSSTGASDRCAKKIASSTSSSGTSPASPSTIRIASRLPATKMFMSLRSKSCRSGLMTSWPSIRPTRAPAMGPSKGMSEMVRAAEAPIMARIAVSFCLSAESTVAITWISL